MPRFLLLLLLLSGTILPDVIVRPSEPEEERYFLDFYSVKSYAGKVFILSNLVRDDYTTANEITNLNHQRYIKIKKNSANPVIYIFAYDSLLYDYITTGQPLSDLLSRLKETGKPYLKAELDISRVFKKKYGNFDEIYLQVSVTELTDTTFKTAITSFKIYEEGELKKEAPFKPEALLPSSNSVLYADVAPEPEGLFAGDLFYFLLPLAGIIAVVVIYIRRRSAGRKE